MRKVYMFLIISIWLAFFVCISCICWLEFVGYNLTVLLTSIFAGIYGLFMGVAAISLEVDLIAEGK